MGLEKVLISYLSIQKSPDFPILGCTSPTVHYFIFCVQLFDGFTYIYRGARSKKSEVSG